MLRNFFILLELNCFYYLKDLGGARLSRSLIYHICAPQCPFLSGHLLSEFAGDGVVVAQLLLEDGEGLEVVGSRGLFAGLPFCHLPKLACFIDAGDGGEG